MFLVGTGHRRSVHVPGHEIVRVLATKSSQQEPRRDEREQDGVFCELSGHVQCGNGVFIDQVHTVGDVKFSSDVFGRTRFYVPDPSVASGKLRDPWAAVH